MILFLVTLAWRAGQSFYSTENTQVLGSAGCASNVLIELLAVHRIAMLNPQKVMKILQLIQRVLSYIRWRLLRAGLTVLVKRTPNDDFREASECSQGLLNDSTNVNFILKTQKVKQRLASHIMAMPVEDLLSEIYTGGYAGLANPTQKSLQTVHGDSELKTELLRTFEMTTGEGAQRALLALALYYNPFELPRPKLFQVVESMDIRFLEPVYQFLFNVFFPANREGDANRQALYLEECLAWFERNLQASLPAIRSDKIKRFAKTYSGSYPISNEFNLKEVVSSERRLLKIFTDDDFSIPIPEFKRALQNEAVKPRMGIIRHNFLGEIHYFKHLFIERMSREYEIYILTFSDIGHDEFRLKYPHLNFRIYSAEKLDEAIEQMRSLNLDVLINSTSLTGNFINPVASVISYRIAPIQFTSWADVTTSGIPSSEYVLVGRALQHPEIHNEMTEKVVSLSGMGYYMPPPHELDPTTKPQARAKLGISPDTLVFVSHAHVFKITPELMSEWLKIIKSIPGSKLLITPFNSDFMKNRFERTFIEMVERLCAEHQVSRNRVLISRVNGRTAASEVVLAGDIYLDSFPYSGPTSAVEALSVHLPVVALTLNTFRGCLAAGILNELSLQSLVAKDRTEYRKIAQRLANDLEFRARVQTTIKENFKVASFFNCSDIAEDFYSVLEQYR